MSRIQNERKGCSCLRYVRIRIRSGDDPKEKKLCLSGEKTLTLSLLPYSLPLMAYFFACYLHIIYMLFAYYFYYIFFKM